MELVGEQWVAAPPQRVWQGLNDPEVLRASIPGCQSLEKEADNRFAAVAEVRIGPIGARFKGAVTLSDLDPPHGYTIAGSGNGGIAGTARGGAKVRLDEENGGTRVRYVVDAEVGGRMAQLGGPIIDATAKQLAGKFFDRFGEIVGGVPVAQPAAAAAAAPLAEPAAAAAAAEGAPAPFVIPPRAPAGPQYPWSWVIGMAVALLAGFLLGRSEADDWWAVAVMVLLLVAAGAGYQAGRRGVAP